MAVQMTLQELEQAEEVELGSSSWIEVTQDMVDTFADATLDHQWIHVDRERAADGPFGGTIAHGFLTVSLLPALIGQLIDITDSRMGVNYGMDRLRLTSPVAVGSRVRATGKLTDTQPKGDGVLMTIEAKVEIEGAERPALVCTSLLLRYP